MKYLSLTFLVLVSANVFVWYAVLTGEQEHLEIYFLDVGQGDSILAELPGGAQVLVDGGPGKDVLFKLAEVLPQTDRYIDLLVLTHPQLDHFGGLYDVVERYRVGALLVTGRDGESEAWDDFVELIERRGVRVILAEAGDTIRYQDNIFAVLNPNQEFLNDPEVNESSVVLGIESEGVKALFTGDIGFPVENYLVDAYDIDVDILKVGHHGSRFSSGQKFLAEVTPEISVIGVGKNYFGHPTEAALNRLRQAGSSVYRTDQNGTVQLRINDGVIGVYTEK